MLLLAAGLLDLTSPADPGPAPTEILAGLAFAAALLAPYAVGIVLTHRVPRHGAGWAFCGLATALAWSAFTDEYATRALSEGSDVPAAELMATFSDSSFVGWFVFLTLCLHYTTGSGTTTRLRRLPWVSLVAAGGFQVGAMLRSTELAGYPGLSSPWAVPALSGPAEVVSAATVVIVGLCLLASVYEVVSAFRRSRGEARQQLLWLVAGAVPLAPGRRRRRSPSRTPATTGWPAWSWSRASSRCRSGAGLSVAEVPAVRRRARVTDSSAYALSSRRGGRRLRPGGAGDHPDRPGWATPRRWLDRRSRRSRRPGSPGRRTSGHATPSTDGSTGGASTRSGSSSAGWRPAAPTSRRCCARPSATRAPDLVFADRQGVGHRRRPRGATTGRDASTSSGTASVTARLRVRPGADRPGRRGRGRGDGGGRDRQPRAARRAGPAGRAGQRVAHPTGDARTSTSGDGWSATCTTVPSSGSARDRPAAAVRPGQRRRDACCARRWTGRSPSSGSPCRSCAPWRAVSSRPRWPAAGCGPPSRSWPAGSRSRSASTSWTQRYPPTLESAAWFVVAEGVANAVKHADVDAVDIAARRRAGASSSSPCPTRGRAAPTRVGSGLQGLADRVAALGGRCRCRPGPTGGTRLEAVFPCAS